MSADGPLVSIIVAVYNGDRSIDKTLRSALAQSYGRKEIVVIDGGSTDGTWRRIEEYAGALAYRISERDRGIADAYNKGIRAARGEWIYFLNSDDLFADDGVLEQVFAGRDIAADVNLVVGTVAASDGRMFDGRFNWRMLIRNQVHHQAIFYRARLLCEFPYNAAYRSYGHDHEHNLALWRRRERVLYLPKVIALWARGGVSDTATWRQYREEFRVRRNGAGRWAYPFNVFSVLRFAAKRLRQL